MCLICKVILFYLFIYFTGTKKKHSLKNILFLSVEEIPIDPHFPSGEIGPYAKKDCGHNNFQGKNLYILFC